LSLYREDEPAVIAKLAENTLTVMVVAGGKLKLFRCLTLGPPSEDEIRAVLQPTLAYAEDELGAPVKRIIQCGLAGGADDLVLSSAFSAEPLRSRFGTPSPFNTGLLGYLEAAGA